MKKKIIILLIVIASIAILLVAAFFIYYYSYRLSYEGIINGNVQSTVQIDRSEEGVPFIRAENIDDVYFALGFLHSQDRYAILEYYRAIAYGRISKIEGENAIIIDRLANIVGFARKAREIEKDLSEASEKNIIAYVNGINAARRFGDDDEIFNREWNATDVISILLLKEWGNSFLNNKEMIFQLPESMTDKEIINVIPPDKLSIYKEKEQDSVYLINKVKDLVRIYIGTFNRGIAFYISSRNTKKQKYYTGFGYESDLRLYPGMYPVIIKAGEVEIKGITYAGLPFIFSGNNKDITFYGFNVNIDTQDFCIEKVKRINDSTQYLSRFGWKEFEAIREPLADLKKEGKKVIIWKTDNGPVLNDIFEGDEYQTEVVTLMSSFPDGSYIESLFAIPFSKTIDDAAKAVRNINSLPKVYLFGSDEFVIKAFSGKVPIRKMGQEVFKKGEQHFWRGMQDLSLYNNKTFFSTVIGSSNGVEIPMPLNQYLVSDNDRFERLQGIFDTEVKFTERNVELAIVDLFSEQAKKFTPLFISILKNNFTPSARLTRIYFHDWKYNMDTYKVSPALYTALVQRFMQETYKDEIPDHIDGVMKNYSYLVPKFYEIVKKGDTPLFDDITTYDEEENREKIFDRAFLKTMRFLSRERGPLMDKWNWGTFHKGQYYIPLKEKSIIEKLIYKAEDSAFYGDNTTIFYGSTSLNLQPLRVTSLIGVFNESKASVYLNYSYSTHPMSRFYYRAAKKMENVDLNTFGAEYSTVINPLK